MLCPFVLTDRFCQADERLAAEQNYVCDKTLRTCREIFHNEMHYGGYKTERSREYD